MRVEDLEARAVEAQRAVDVAVEAVAAARRERDVAVADLIASGVSEYRVASLSGLSRPAVAAIRRRVQA